MNSEKVKEIKKALKYNIKLGLSYEDDKKPCKIWLAEILTLINELESENSYQKEHIELWFKKNEEKKKRIAELEKENAELKVDLKNSIDMQNQMLDGFNTAIKEVELNLAREIPNLLKQFAERLKEKFNDTEYRAMTKRKTISVEELKAQMDWILHEVVIKNIDETLKEFIK